ncbi:MAG TPA: tetratricopeptide repeat protein, partial [Polyangiaceae bacterium]|nr:tetratricopeptide repeat protein [Polyangiaceae bacterium]
MFTVECPECKGNYQVDERRIPASGLRMRCPKCSAGFVVQKPEALGTQAVPPATDSPEDVALPATKTLGEPRKPPRPIPGAFGAAGDNKPASAMVKKPEVGAKLPPPSSHAHPVPTRRVADTLKDLRKVGGDAPAPTAPEPRSVQSPPTTKPAGSAAARGLAPGSADDDLPQLALGKATTPGRSNILPQRAIHEEADLPDVRDLDSYLPAALEPSRASAQLPGTSRPGPRARAAPDELDLPLFVPQKREAPSPEARTAPRQSASPEPLELDLPSPLSGRADLPAPGRSFPPAAESGDLEFELPSPLHTEHRGPSSDLPAPLSIELALPSVQGRADTTKKTILGTGTAAPRTPVKTLAGVSHLPEIDLGFDFEGSDTGDRLSDSGLPPALKGPSPSLPPALGGAGMRMQTERPLESLSNGLSSSLLPAPVPARSEVTPLKPQTGTGNAVGGTGYGEVQLEPMEQDLSVDTEGQVGRRSLTGESLEFGGVPEQREGRAPSEAVAPPRIDESSVARPPVAPSVALSPAAEAPTSVKAKSRRTRVLAGIALGVVAIAGGALTLLPDIGPFGAHFIADQIHRKDHEALLRRHIEAGHSVLAKDDFSGVAKALASLEAAQREHERLRELRAYYAFFVYAVSLRHGSQPREQARAKVALDELGDRRELRYVGIARAMRAMVEGNLARARQTISELISADSRNSDAVVVSAEISMLERRYPDALQAWQQVERLEQSARSSYGLARAHLALTQYDAAKRDAELTIARNPRHVGARLTLARVTLETQRDFELAQKYTLEALSQPDELSVAEFVAAKTLSGDLHLLGSRISLAEAAYQEALAKDPRSSAALRGLGETLYRAGRYSESLARFEAGLQADPDDVMVAVGVAKAQLALERVREAGT